MGRTVTERGTGTASRGAVGVRREGAPATPTCALLPRHLKQGGSRFPGSLGRGHPAAPLATGVCSPRGPAQSPDAPSGAELVLRCVRVRTHVCACVCVHAHLKKTRLKFRNREILHTT